MERTPAAVEDVVFRPTNPPVGLVLIIVRRSIENPAITSCPGQRDLYRPPRIIDGGNRRTVSVFPIPIALGFIPLCKPIQDVHW